jgi:hypothetical protein
MHHVSDEGRFREAAAINPAVPTSHVSWEPESQAVLTLSYPGVWVAEEPPNRKEDVPQSHTRQESKRGQTRQRRYDPSHHRLFRVCTHQLRLGDMTRRTCQSLQHEG